MLNDQCNWGGERRGGVTWSFYYGLGLAPTLLTLENHNYNMGDHKFYKMFAKHMKSHLQIQEKIQTMNSMLIIMTNIFFLEKTTNHLRHISLHLKN